MLRQSACQPLPPGTASERWNILPAQVVLYAVLEITHSRVRGFKFKAWGAMPFLQLNPQHWRHSSSREQVNLLEVGLTDAHKMHTDIEPDNLIDYPSLH